MAFGNPDARFNIRATDKTKTAFKSVRSNMDGMRTGLIGLRAGIAAVVGAGGLGLLISRSIETGDKFQKLEQSLGISTEAMSQYRLITSRAGVTSEQFALILQRQTRRVAEAAVGLGEAKGALRELNLNAEDLAKLSPDRQFEAIADAMQKVENQSDRLRLAFKLFDSEGARPALQAMAGGAEQLRAYRQEAEDMGLTITQLEANQMAAFNDRLQDSQLAITAASERLTVTLGPALAKAATWFAKATSEAAVFWSEVFGGEQVDLEAKALDEELQQLTKSSEALQKNLEIMREVPGAAVAVAELERQFAAVKERISEVNNEILGGSEFIFNPPDVTGAGGTDADAKAAEREEMALNRLKTAQANKLEVIQMGLLSEEEAETQAFLNRMLVLEENYELELITLQKFQDIKTNLELKHEDRLNKIRVKNEKKVSKDLVNLRADVANKSIGILRMLGNESKIFAVAAIAIEAGIAAKKIFIESQVAAMAALTPPPVGLGPVAGQALAAQILAMGKVSAGLTLAAGVLQIGSLTSSGGSSGGSDAQGVFQADPFTGTPLGNEGLNQTDRTVRTDLTINLGDNRLVSAETIRELMEEINEQIDDGVVLGSIQVA